MNAVSLTSEVLRSRLFLLQGPPRGTSSRILKARLGRVSRRPFAHVSETSSQPSVQPFRLPRHGYESGLRSQSLWSHREEKRDPVAVPKASPDTATGSEPSLAHDEVLLLRKILLDTPPAPELPLVGQEAAPPPRHTGTADPSLAADMRVAESPPSDWRTEILFHRLRAGDTRALYRWLVPTVAPVAGSSGGASSALAEEKDRRYRIAALLPPTVFSELLRCLDPFAVSQHRDYAQDIAISAGLASFTPLQGQVNTYGIRVIYPALLGALMSVYELRTAAQLGLHMHDYIVLLRCAGAASDILAARRIWHGMEEGRFVRWRQSEAYAEFIRARFLTEALYTQHDIVRLRVRPWNLHRQKLMLHPTRLQRLDGLRMALELKKVDRFGQNPNEAGYAEDLTRILRKTKPPRRIYRTAVALGYAHDERLLAAIMIAYGRNGSVRQLSQLLANCWKVQVVRDRNTGRATVRGGEHFRPGAPMRPSVVLLDAVVQAYCCSGEVALGLQVADFLSRRYNIPIPDKLWFDLLSWTYIMTTKPASTEWTWAGFPHRVLKPDTTEMIWTTMTSEPYNVQPGFAQYDILIKTLIKKRRVDKALELMRQAKPLYQAQLCEYEDAMLEYAEAVRQQVSLGAASKRYQRAANKKWYMWYCFQVWCWGILKGLKARGHHDPVVVQTVPRMIDEFRPFIPSLVRYRTQAGLVEIKEPHSHPKYVSERRTIELPPVRPHVTFQHRKLENKADLAHLRGRHDEWKMVRGAMRRRSATLRRALWSRPDLRTLGRRTSREWLVREFA